jgi:hypothetical protein
VDLDVATADRCTGIPVVVRAHLAVVDDPIAVVPVPDLMRNRSTSVLGVNAASVAVSTKP